MNRWLFFLLLFQLVAGGVVGQVYPTTIYEVTAPAGPTGQYVTVMNDQTTFLYPFEGYYKYGFSSYDEQYINELSSPTAKHYGSSIKFYYYNNSPGIYVIRGVYRTRESDFWDSWWVHHNTDKRIYIYVKPNGYLNNVTLPVGGDEYVINAGDNSISQGSDCNPDFVEMGFRSAYYQYFSGLPNSNAVYGLSQVSFNPSKVGTYTLTPVSRFADYPSQNSCVATYKDTKEWQPVTITVENFTWKATAPNRVCVNQGFINLSSIFNIASGVSFEGTGVSGVNFNPATAGIGVHTINAKKTYNPGTSSSFVEYEPLTIEVIQTPTLNSILPATTCSDLDLRDYFQSNLQGGVWSFSALNPTNNSLTGGIAADGYTLSPSLATLSTVRVRAFQTLSGCTQGSIDFDIDVVPGGSGALSILNTASYCQATGSVSLSYSLSGATASSVTWSGPGVSGSTLNLSSAIPGQEITVATSITTTSGCVLNASKKILVKQSPSSSFLIQELVLCNSGQTINLKDQFQPKDLSAPIDGSWSSSVGTLNTKILGNTLNLNNLAQGSYPLTFSYTNSSGCTSTSVLSNSIKVYDQPSANLVLNVSPQEQVCSATNFTLSTPAVGSNLGINWFSPNGYIGGTPSISTGTMNTGEYTYTLVVNNNTNGECKSLASVILEVENPTPLSFATSNVSVCQGEYVVDLNSKIGANYDSLLFSSTNSVIQSRLAGFGNKDLNMTGIVNGNYPVTVTVSYQSCSITKDFNLNVTNGYGDPSVSGSTILCEPKSTTLSVLGPVPALQYRWFETMASNSPLHTGAGYLTPVLTQNTSYYLQGINSATKCVTNRVPINMVVLRMDTLFMHVGNDLSSCTNMVSFNLARPVVTPVGGSWSGPGVSGSTFNGNSLANNKAYSIIYSYTQGVCTKRDTLQITLGIDLKPTVSKSVVFSGELVQFSHNYPDATSTLWTFGDGTKSTDWQAKHYYYGSGNKNVTLAITVEQNGSCAGTITKPGFVQVIDTMSVITLTEDPVLSHRNLSFYPTYFESSLFLRSETSLGPVNISVIAPNGTSVLQRHLLIDGGDITFLYPSDTATLPKGLYIIRVVGAGAAGSLVFRVIRL